MSDAISEDYWSSAEEIDDINDVDEVLEEETPQLTKAHCLVKALVTECP